MPEAELWMLNIDQKIHIAKVKAGKR